MEQVKGKKPLTLKTANSLAMNYINQGNYTMAEPLLKKALMGAQRKLGPDHPTVATCLESYAALIRMMNPLLSRLPWSKVSKMEAKAAAIRSMHGQVNPEDEDEDLGTDI